jgi:hypothetical protein
LILSQSDSLVIFYRKDAGMEWQPVEFTSVGPWTIGYLYVENMQMGDYTLGVYDLSVGTEEVTKENESEEDMAIFPNPSKDVFNIRVENEKAEQLIIYTLEGKVVKNFLLADSSSVQWNPANLPYGTYVAVLKRLNGKIITTRKIVFMK